MKKEEIITNEEIKSLLRIKTDKGIKRLFPESKLLYSKLSFCFYQIKPKVWIRCDYMMKDGICFRDIRSGVTSFNTDDIDWNHLRISKIYTGNEKTQNYKDIWSYNGKLTKSSDY